MKNINKSKIMGLIGMDVINIKNEEVGTVVGDFNGKYIVNVDGEEKFYSESTLIRNWKIVEEETEEEVINENDEMIEEETKDVIDEENTEDENKADEVVEEETEETSNEEIITEEINDEDEIVDETEEVINENDEVIEEETEDVINENDEVIEEETEDVINENDEVIEEETEEVINENNKDEIVDEIEDVINENDETEEFVLETENEGIIDNIKETEGRVKITGHLYGVPVKFDKINQTTVWKTLIKLYDNRKDENDKYSLDDKKYLVRQLKQLNEEVFAGAFRCLVSKTKQNYIEELMK